jgi:hypothetical protein
MPLPSPEDQVQFLLNIQRLLTEGQFTATYKYALLLALAVRPEPECDIGGLIKTKHPAMKSRAVTFGRQSVMLMVRVTPSTSP